MAQYGMLPHIREHSLLVTEAVLWLGQGLIEAGLPLNLPLIETGALLHDLGKTPCLGTPANHAEWGAKVLEDLGYPEVAQVVREHVRLADNALDLRPLREAEVVNYADKRVLHTRVVTLDRRFADLKERYGKTAEALARINANELRSQSLEQKIFGYLPWTPNDLLHLNHIGREP
jgi:putative nucleotidyltransferase with HDIG domain